MEELGTLIGAAAALLLLAAPARADDRPGAVYDPAADAGAGIDAALAAARMRGAPALVVFGADWCHDSRGLAAHLSEDPALAAFMDETYEIVFVDIGERDRNLDQLARFGVDAVYGTPTPVIVDGDGRPVAAQSVHAWRTAYDAGTADLAAYFARHSRAGAAPVTAEASADLTAIAESWPSYLSALEQLDDLPEGRRADARAYADGMAISMARLSMGRVARDMDYAAADRADLDALGADPGVDISEAVAGRLAGYEIDLIARWREQQD
ncbi:thioredoxin family protein [Maricaulaceae bacterium MS644]